MSELFDAVDALIASVSPLPPPAERRRLRSAHGLTQEQIAGALRIRRATVSDWEAGRTEPRQPEREAYAHLLRNLARLHPGESAASPRVEPPAPDDSVTPPASSWPLDTTSRPLEPDEFEHLFTTFTHTAWRLEGRRRYGWHERQPEYRAFTEGSHVHWDIDAPWCRNRRAQTAQGKRFQRVRIIDEPHTECQLYLLLQNTPRNAATGEDIRFLTRAGSGTRGLPDEDFWIFDTAAVAVLRFDDEDEVTGTELITAPVEVLRYAQARDAAWHHAVSQERMADGLGV
ncbi:DUF6879 family protein [Streptomyces sp. NPDC048277]|uniref:helix-turn-helix domain-containing protein n=1 Tax=Streptomyces sp. NPDC048277 TaxID=3155027 RepID=UPI0033C2D4B0